MDNSIKQWTIIIVPLNYERSDYSPKDSTVHELYRQFGKYKTYNAQDKTRGMHSANGSASNTDIYSVSAEKIINDGFSYCENV